MTHHIQDLMDVLAELSEVKGFKVAISQSLKGGLIAGGSAAAGGMLLGPLGLLIGSLVGGMTAFANTHGKFKSVAIVLSEMTPDQKRRLYDRVKTAVTNINPHEVVSLAAFLLTSTPNIQDVAMKTLANYLSSEMNLRLV